jgi:cyclase
MKKFFAISAVLGLSVLSFPSFAHEHLDKVEIKTITLSDSVSMLVGEGGNIGVSAGKDGVFMIDDQFAPLTEKITAAIQKISDQPIRFVLNTHWHFDHTGGNENLGKKGVTIVAHDNVRKTMSVDQALKAFNMTVPAAAEVALPSITFNDTTTFHLNGETIKVQHVEPAHTDGDSVVFFEKANIVHMGDTFFNGLYPFIDTEHGGSIKGMIKATDYVLGLIDDETKIIPGHGPLATKKDLMAFHDMLVGVEKVLSAQKEAGKSVDEIVKGNPLKDYNDKWGNGFLKPEQFVQIVLSGM